MIYDAAYATNAQTIRTHFPQCFPIKTHQRIQKLPSTNVYGFLILQVQVKAHKCKSRTRTRTRTRTRWRHEQCRLNLLYMRKLRTNAAYHAHMCVCVCLCLCVYVCVVLRIGNSNAAPCALERYAMRDCKTDAHSLHVNFNCMKSSHHAGWSS